MGVVCRFQPLKKNVCNPFGDAFDCCRFYCRFHGVRRPFGSVPLQALLLRCCDFGCRCFRVFWWLLFIQRSWEQLFVTASAESYPALLPGLWWAGFSSRSYSCFANRVHQNPSNADSNPRFRNNCLGVVMKNKRFC